MFELIIYLLMILGIFLIFSFIIFLLIKLLWHDELETDIKEKEDNEKKKDRNTSKNTYKRPY